MTRCWRPAAVGLPGQPLVFGQLAYLCRQHRLHPTRQRMRQPPHVLAYCRIGLAGSCQPTSTPAACVVGEMVAAGFGGTAGAVAALAAACSSNVLSCRGAIGIGSDDGRYSIRSLNASLYRGSVLISSC